MSSTSSIELPGTRPATSPAVHCVCSSQHSCRTFRLPRARASRWEDVSRVKRLVDQIQNFVILENKTERVAELDQTRQKKPNRKDEGGREEDVTASVESRAFIVSMVYWDDMQCPLTSKHGVCNGFHRVQLWSQAIFHRRLLLFSKLLMFFSNAVLHGERAFLIGFSLKLLHLLIPGPFVVLVLGTWTTLVIIFTSVWNLVGSNWSWLVYGEIFLFLVPDYGSHSTHSIGLTHFLQ